MVDENGIDTAMNLMQDYIDNEKLIIKYDLVSNALESMKEFMSADEWREFRD
jgi:hypothetical protein